ncbi:hypothetical protein HMF8227_02968 [Saliniradius amylolyticus]|uniref:DUF3014 domain-containing protein n=1 Tax=Saliniradius amylolyticus TaxID=2183582 RepID=A0A2S2E6X9_9ALTE|nr:DUF3014 domain-containing protein [Saliniradius amylolyticus]AWL13416.1 hypothetical protein HMF8227_02968 [Saliniradius amylolyticus]
MTEQDTQTSRSLVPYILIAIVILAVVLGIYFWRSSEPATEQPKPVTETPLQPVTESQSQQAEPEPQEPSAPEPVERPDPVTEPEPDPAPEPELPDISDSAIKTALSEAGAYEAVARLLVDEDLLRRFVVFSVNAADEELAPRHGLVKPPEQSFKTYQQAGKEWIDAASYKRYTPYAEALDSMETETLLSLYDDYKPVIQEIYGEIGRGGEFDYVLMDAIDHLLDTPEVPMPVEVKTESVMYQYADPHLESLSALQKQLLRTGPENMRIIKAKLRELKQALINKNGPQ